MTTQIKTTLLTGLFFFGLLTGLQAQDKYEFATITFFIPNKELGISINGTEYKNIPVSKDEVKSNWDTNAALKQVNKMQDEGWELFDTETVGANFIYVFYLRKKIG